MEGRKGWVFRSPGGVFCGRFWGGGAARMGGFAAEFRGFWTGRGCGAAIQRTADSAGAVWAKKFLKTFKKGGENPEIGVKEVPNGDPRAPYIGCAGRFLSAIFRSEG